MSQLTDNLSAIVAIKSNIKDAIESKGVDMTGVSFGSYADKIGEITTQFVTEPLSVSVNGTYTPSQGVDGFSQVVVNVPQSVSGYTVDQVVEGNLGISVLSTTASEMKTIGCWSTVTEVNMPNIIELPSKAFYYATALSQVYLPNVKVINEFAFYECESITSLDLPSCTHISGNAFHECYNLETISLPNCEELGYDAFAYCQNLSSLSLPSLKMMGALGSCGISYFELPSTTAFQFDYYTFSYMSRLQKVVLPIIASMGGYNFYGCPSLTELEMNTENYIIPYYNETIYDTPLNSGIGSIYVAANMLEKWQSAEGWSNFSSLFVGVGDSTSTMLSITSEGLVYGETKTTWWYVSNALGVDGNAIKEVSLPNCKMIASIAFTENYSLSSVNSPVAESIGWTAFGNCYNLQTVNLPACKKIDAYAFQYCSSLQTITLPLCEEIYEYAFAYCSSLSEIVLPVCSYLGGDVLQDCSMLNKLVLGSNSVCSVHNMYFMYPDNVSILVPASLVDAYKSAQYWSAYSSRIFPIPE